MHMASSENHYDAIVVGGGLTGLIAARELCEVGQRTLLVESRDRLGGRTNTVEFAGHQIESGGTFFDLENEPDMQDDGGIEFTSRSGETFTASHGVWAVPLNTWEDVEFTPALSPGKQAASKLKHIGRQHKLWMRVRGVPTGIYGISYESPFKMLVHHAQLENGETLIFAMTEHTQLDCDDNDAVQRALQVLVPEAEVLETYYEDWINSEFSKGTWMVAPPGFLSNYASDLDQPEGRLHFAGADVNLRWLSWMVGCVVSGKKAAAEIAARSPAFT
jgi:monoamine oxidase